MNSRPNRVLAVVVGAIIVVAVAAVIFSATRPTPTYEPGTPERVLQRYLTAVIDGDSEEAAALLDDDGPCSVEDLDRSYVAGDGVRAVLRDTEVDGDSARVEVDIVMSSGAPFGGSEWTEEHTFRLTRSAGDWRITGAPWPMYDCAGEWRR